jgi:hypothetical protein
MAHQFCFGLTQFAAVHKVNGLDARLACLRQKSTHATRKIDVRCEHNVLLMRERGQVHGILHHAELEIIAHLAGDLNAHGLLRFSR